MSDTHRSLALFAALVLSAASLIACGEDAEDDSGGDKGVGENCAANTECASGLVCVGGLCQDPNATPNPGVDPNPTPDPMPGMEPTPDPNPTPNPDANPDPMPGVEPDPMPDPMPGPEPDPVERPDVLTGGVSVFEFNVTANVFLTIRRGNVGAAFVEPTTPDAPIATIGDCDVVNVSTATEDVFGYSAGPLTVQIDNQEYTLNPTRSGDAFSYAAPLPDDNESIFGSGANISVNTPGGPHVGAFSGNITAPNDHQLSSPAADESVNGNQDLTLNWTGGGSGNDVVVTISPMDDFFMPKNGPGLSCTPSSDTGSLVIPAAAMAELGGPKLAIVVIKASTALQDVNGDEIALNATYAAGNIVNLR